MTKDEIKSAFDRDGVVRIPGVFTQDEVNKIRADAMMSLSRFQIFPPHKRVRIQAKVRDGVEFPALSFWPTLTSPYLNEIRRDERLAGIVRHILGPEVKQLNNQFYFRLPGDGDEFAWHQDVFFRDNDEEFPGIFDKYLQTAIVLDEITEQSGAVEYVLGSHKQGRVQLLDHDEEAPEKLRKFVRGEYNGVKMTAKPGDLMVWSVMIIHGSEANKTNHPRMVYMNGFAAADASKYFPYYMREGKCVENLDPSLFPETQKQHEDPARK